MRLTFFDVEFANIRNKAICQIGILSRDLSSNEEDVRIDLLINPEDEFDDNCVRIHNIKKEDIISEKTFPAIWKSIEIYFTNSIIIGHNVANTDLFALKKTLERYKIQVPKMYYICTYDLARKIIPPYMIRDYSLRTLCDYFNIELPLERKAFYNVCACSDIFDNLREKSNFDISKFITPFELETLDNAINYNSNISLKKDINSLYGMIKGFSLDSIISDEEKQFIIDWRNNFSIYKDNKEISEIIDTIDNILLDNKITSKEIKALEINVRKHLDIVSTSIITLSTQVLNGILKGIIIDDKITDEECSNLRMWLYDNSYLAGHYPYDRLTTIIESILEDEYIDDEEVFLLLREIEALLEPIEKLKREFNSLDGKTIYLTHTFREKEAVKKYILDNGGKLSNTLNENVDLVVTENYVNSREVKKLSKYKEEGIDIRVISKKELKQKEQPFKDILRELMFEKNLTEVEIYKPVGLSRQLFSKIFCLEGYTPHKNTICTIAISMKLNLEETNRLLYSAGYVLSRSFVFDKIIEESILNNEYDIFEINEKLYDQDSPTLLGPR